MIKINRIFNRKNKNISIFSESTLKTSFYEELQKNEWCNVIDDKPDNLMELIKIKINKSRKA
ncbi:hypothetical protein [Ezakiella coagulans]|uniref:hypothetical protein n=1 Tax=Ezakiella coagulans TaxID=46507 RepID=UPI000E309E7F|nr:hypothetical protein [Ezakiella coagulans]